MNNFMTLHDAFEELERQADTFPVGADRSAGAPSAGPPSAGAPSTGALSTGTARRRVRPQRLVLVAATVLVVAALAAGFGLLARHRTSTTTAGSQTPVPTRSVTSVRPPTPTPSRVAPPPAGFPRDAATVAATLHAVLGSSVTFTWSEPAGANGAVIAGVLTDSATGRRGSFDLQTELANPGDTAQCEDAELSHCTPRLLPDGSSESVGRETAGYTLYLVSVVQPNGATLVMHVSNTSDPKRGGTTLATAPPLTTDQIVALLRSPLWHAR